MDQRPEYERISADAAVRLRALAARVGDAPSGPRRCAGAAARRRVRQPRSGAILDRGGDQMSRVTLPHRRAGRPVAGRRAVSVGLP
jgi:hypothetical protein